MKKKIIVAIISITVLILAGCGNKAVEVMGEIEDMQEVADASTPEPTSTPAATATPAPTQAPTPEPTPDTNLAEDEYINDKLLDLYYYAQELANGSNNHSSGDGVQWIYTDGDFWDQILAAAGDDLSDEEWNKLMEEMAASMLYAYENGSSSGQSSNSGGSSSSGGNSSSGNTTSSQNSGSSGGGSSSGSGSTNNNTGSGAGNTTSGQSAGSSGGGSSSGNGTNNNTGNTGNTTPSAPAAPEQPAQHSHSYAWVESGDSRILTCSCGVTTGITEYRHGSVWGYYDDGAAGSLWNLVNEQRNATQYTVQEGGFTIAIENVPSLNSSADLTTKARNRAIEAATNFDHGSNTDECLAWGYSSVTEAKSAWVASTAHRVAMTNESYVNGGVACFYFDSDNSGTNLTLICVLELGY